MPKWEFAKSGHVRGWMSNLSYFGQDCFGEYTTLIDCKTLKKKHVIDVDVQRLNKFLSENGKIEQGSGPYADSRTPKTRTIMFNKKFLPQILKGKKIIIDKEWME